MNLNSPRILIVAAVPATLDVHLGPIAKHLAESGWHISAACGSGRPQRTEFADFHQLPNLRRAGPLTLMRSLFEMVRIFRDVQPDLIYLNTPYVLVLGRLAALLTKRKSVAAVLGTLIEPPGTMSFAFRLVEATLSSLSSTTVVLNERDEQFYQRWSRKDSVVRAPVGGAGLDLDHVAEVRSAERVRPQRLMVLGRLTPDKGLDLICEAFTELRRESPDLQLVFAGQTIAGEQPWFPPEWDGVRTLGWVDDPLMEIRRSSVLVTASRREGYPVALLESVAVGTPVAAVRNSGSDAVSLDFPGRVFLCDYSLAGLLEAIRAAMASAANEPPPSEELLWAGQDSVACFHAEVLRTTLLGCRPQFERRPK